MSDIDRNTEALGVLLWAHDIVRMVRRRAWARLSLDELELRVRQEIELDRQCIREDYYLKDTPRDFQERVVQQALTFLVVLQKPR
jgi:hypothetical protein